MEEETNPPLTTASSWGVVESDEISLCLLSSRLTSHIYIGIYGYMDIWIYGYMDIWICTRTLYFSHIHAGIGTKCLLLLADKWVFSTSCACLLTCIKLFLLFQQILRKMQEIDVMVPNVLNWSIIIQTSLGCKHYRDKTTEHTQIHPHNLCDFEALLLLLNQNLTGF